MTFLTDPVAWWIDPFQSDLMRDALVAALLTVITTSVVGTWVVLRGLSFFGDALAHGVLPGIAIASIAGASTGFGAMAAAAAMVVGVSLIRRHSPLPDDTSIGVLFVGFLALAVALLSTETGRKAGNLEAVLFGSITAIDGSHIQRQLIVAVITVAGVAILFRALLVTTFDELLARTLGFRPQLVHLALLVLLALSIVSTFETVGSLLVFAFLIAPPAAAALVTRHVPVMMLAAVLIGAVSAYVGLLISYHHRTGTGATMALCTVVVFLVVLVATSVRRTIVTRTA